MIFDFVKCHPKPTAELRAANKVDGESVALRVSNNSRCKRCRYITRFAVCNKPKQVIASLQGVQHVRCSDFVVTVFNRPL